MYRRNFIRVLGGGVIVAAGAAGAGCSSAVPPEAMLPALGERRWSISLQPD